MFRDLDRVKLSALPHTDEAGSQTACMLLAVEVSPVTDARRLGEQLLALLLFGELSTDSKPWQAVS